MIQEVAFKRRAVLERQLEKKFCGQLVEFHSIAGEVYGRIQTIGIEWVGADTFTITINLDGRRYQSDYHHFMETTEIL